MDFVIRFKLYLRLRKLTGITALLLGLSYQLRICSQFSLNRSYRFNESERKSKWVESDPGMIGFFGHVGWGRMLRWSLDRSLPVDISRHKPLHQNFDGNGDGGVQLIFGNLEGVTEVRFQGLLS